MTDEPDYCTVMKTVKGQWIAAHMRWSSPLDSYVIYVVLSDRPGPKDAATHLAKMVADRLKLWVR